MVRALVLAALLLGALTAGPSAGIAGAGWYVMAPPRDSVPDNLDPAYLPLRSWTEVQAKLLVTVPLSRWASHGTFDTATACEALRAERQNQAMQWLDTALRSRETREQNAATEELAYWGLSICVASDDPRLR